MKNEHGFTSYAMQGDIFNIFSFGCQYVWCEAHQKMCGPKFLFVRAGELLGPGNGMFKAIPIIPPIVVV